METNRRQFVMLSACVLAGGCAQEPGGNASPALKTVSIDAGPVSAFAADGVYDSHRREGFFVVRQGPKLFALSSICTHRHYTVAAQSNHTFYCKSHGSEFDADGKVTEGPAATNLPELPTSVDESQHLIIHAISQA